MEPCGSQCSGGESDYGTGSACSSDGDAELRRLFSDSDCTNHRNGIATARLRCPHCCEPLDDPVVLKCGHTLCAKCSATLLEMAKCRNHSLRRRGIRMGVTVGYTAAKSYAELLTGGFRPHSPLHSCHERITPSLPPLVCPICACSTTLCSTRKFVDAAARGDVKEEASKQTVFENPLYSSPYCYDNAAFANERRDVAPHRAFAAFQCPVPSLIVSRSHLSATLPIHISHAQRLLMNRTAEQIINDAKIITCNVAIIGAKRTGKSCLARRQFLNEVFFGGVDDEIEYAQNRRSRLEKAFDRAGEGISLRFMIEFMNEQNCEQNIMTADAILLAYSVVDKESLYEAANLHRFIKQKRNNTAPLVLVGTKADVDKKRWQVPSYEGQAFARTLGCPFVEVSAKNNDRVHEAFVELMRLVDKREAILRRLNCSSRNPPIFV